MDFNGKKSFEPEIFFHLGFIGALTKILKACKATNEEVYGKKKESELLKWLLRKNTMKTRLKHCYDTDVLKKKNRLNLTS